MGSTLSVIPKLILGIDKLSFIQKLPTLKYIFKVNIYLFFFSVSLYFSIFCRYSSTTSKRIRPPVRCESVNGESDPRLVLIRESGRRS